MTRQIESYPKKSKVHFIVGPHRSGTTYLQTLLGCMPGISTGIETHFYCRIRPYLTKLSETRGNYLGYDEFKTAVTEIMFQGNTAKIDWIKLRKYWVVKDWINIFKTLLSETSLPGKRCPDIWIEKTPDHLLHIEQIRKELTDSKFIIIYRDPRRIAVSLHKYVNDITNSQMLGWLKSELRYLNNRFQVIESYVGSRKPYVKIVRYESLCRNSAVELDNICNFLGVEYQKPDEGTFREIAENVILDSEDHKSRNRYYKITGDYKTWNQGLTLTASLYAELALYEILEKFSYPLTYRFLSICPSLLRRKLRAAIDAKIMDWRPHKEPASTLDHYIPWSPGAAKIK